MAANEFGLHINNDFSSLCGYIDGTLNENQNSEISNHLDSCPVCLAKLENLKEAEEAVSGFELGQDFLDDKKEKILNDLLLSHTDSKVKTFFSKPVKVSRGRFFGIASAFVMIAVGAVTLFSPKSKTVTEMIPAANSDLSRDNIYKVSDNRDNMSVREHIKAIEKMGYKVIEESGRIIIEKLGNK